MSIRTVPVKNLLVVFFSVILVSALPVEGSLHASGVLIFGGSRQDQSAGVEDAYEGCTTLVAAGNATSDGSVILAKNRDLEEFEAQWLYYSPRKEHPAGSQVQLQYIEIPQANVTWAWVGSKSHELKWGVGMGINEWGVAVADNDAPTRELLEGIDGLHDNDICRLILERSKTAYEGMSLAGALLEQYGHSHVGQVYWVADAHECWILEGAGHHWAAIRVTDGSEVRANQFQITTHWDAASPGLVEYAIEQGWCNSAQDFSFAKCYSMRGYPYGSSQTRYVRARQILGAKAGNITLSDMMGVLRDHYEGTDMYTRPPHSNSEYRTICCKQTVAAMVAYLRSWLPRQLQLIWYGMSTPCTSLFTPVYASTSAIPKPYLTGVGAKDMSGYESESAWWRLKRLQNVVDEDYAERQPRVRERWDKLFAEERSKAADVERQALSLIEKEQYEDGERVVNEFVNAWLDRAYTVSDELAETVVKPSPPQSGDWSLYLLIGVAVSLAFALGFYTWKRGSKAASPRAKPSGAYSNPPHRCLMLVR